MCRLLFALVLVCGTSLAAVVPTDEDAFTTFVAEHLAAELPGYAVVPAGKLTLTGQRADGESLGRLSLDRVYAYCARNAPRCEAAVGQYSKQIASMVKDRDRPIERSMVRLAIRPAAYAEQVRKQVAAGGGVVYSRGVAPGLVCLPVLDFSQSMRYVIDKDLVKLGLSEEQLFQLGEANLKASAKPLADVTPVPGPHAFGTITGEDYASSRILQHDDWKPLSEQLHGALVVLMPAPDVLLYGDGSTDVGIQALRTYAVDVARKTDHPLPLVMLKWTERGWDVVE